MLLLAETVRIGESEKVYKNEDLDKVHVDSTVQEKNITFPHDLKHLEKMHTKILKKLKKEGITLKQNFRKVIPRLMREYFSNTKRNHYKNARRVRKKICTKLGKLLRATRA